MDRSAYPVRVARLRETDEVRQDLSYWLSKSPGERIDIVWPLTLDAWAFTGVKDAESRLSRHLVSVQRRTG
jgi:hypothetical protein